MAKRTSPTCWSEKMEYTRMGRNTSRFQ